MTAKTKCCPPDRRRRLVPRRNQAGAALVEFAVVALLFFTILYLLIAFGMALAVKQSITNAASEGARAAIGAQPIGIETLDQAQVRVAKARVAGALDWLGSHYVESRDLKVGTPTPDPEVFIPLPGLCDPVGDPLGPKCITVKVTYLWKGNEIVPPGPGSALLPETFSSESVVQVG